MPVRASGLGGSSSRDRCRGRRSCRLPGQRRKLGLDVRDALGLGRSVASGNCSPILAIISDLVERVGECRFWVRATSDVAAELPRRSEEHTSELQSLMRIPYAVFFLKHKKQLLNKI